VWIATSNKTEPPRSPFNFSDKSVLMHAAGIPNDRIIESSNPYKLPDRFNPSNTIFVVAVGAPDKDRLRPDSYKKDGNPSYFKTFTKLEECTTADNHGYVIIANERKKVIEINGRQVDVSHGTTVREVWNSIRNNPTERQSFILQLYGRDDPEIGRVLDKIQPAEKVTEDIPPPEAARKTQIAGTLGTYKKASDIFKQHGVTGKALDFGAGLGKGTAELGKDAESYEPFPNPDFKPHFVDVTKIPDNSYKRIVNLNVLNVVPNLEKHRIRDEIVRNIGRVLAPGGVAIITTRGRDVLTIKGTPGEEPMSMISSIGTYQKGFTQVELREYISSVLGDGFEVKSIKLGPAGVMIKKLESLSKGMNEGKQGVAEELDNIVAVIDGVRSDRTYNDKDHAHNSLAKLVSYGKAKVAELYVNGEKVEHFEIGKKYLDFEPKKLNEDAAGVGVVKNSKDPRYVMATMGDQNDVTAATLPKMMAGYHLTKRYKKLKEEIDVLKEKWSAKYKRSINCSNPKGFSQRAHCQGRKKK
jgi:SAM-dependent methyltransferase